MTNPRPMGMAYHERARAILHSGLPTTQRMVLLGLSDFCGEDLICWPSRQTLMETTGLSDRAIAKAVSALIDAGWLCCWQDINAKRHGSRRSSIQYRLHLGRAAELSAEARQRRDEADQARRAARQARTASPQPPERRSPTPRTTFAHPPNDVRGPQRTRFARTEHPITLEELPPVAPRRAGGPVSMGPKASEASWWCSMRRRCPTTYRRPHRRQSPSDSRTPTSCS